MATCGSHITRPSSCTNDTVYQLSSHRNSIRLVRCWKRQWNSRRCELAEDLAPEPVPGAERSGSENADMSESLSDSPVRFFDNTPWLQRETRNKIRCHALQAPSRRSGCPCALASLCRASC